MYTKTTPYQVLNDATIGNCNPAQILPNNSATPTIVAGNNPTFILLTAIPNRTAKIMKSIEVVATEGVETNVATTIFAKAAITRIRVNQAKTENNFFPLSPIVFSITCPIDLPSFLTDENNAPKS